MRRYLYNKGERQVLDMRFIFKMVILPFSLLTAFLALMLKLTLNLSAFVLALPMLYIFGCGLYTLYYREWTQFLILFVAEFGCFCSSWQERRLWKPSSDSANGLRNCNGGNDG